MCEMTQLILEPKNENVMKGILKMREESSIGDLKSIELYASDGHLLSHKMAEQSIYFVGYEIDPSKEKGFKRNISNGEFRCGDSVEMMKTINDGEIGYYNLISVDAPICIYGDDYCEHFEIMNYVYKLIAPGEKVLCVFPVVPKPYDTDKKENAPWMKRRGLFYDTAEINLDLDKAVDTYNKVFETQGLQVLGNMYVCREYRNKIDWMYEYIYVLQKQ